MFGEVAQLARAFGSYPKGQGFKSLLHYQILNFKYLFFLFFYLFLFLTYYNFITLYIITLMKFRSISFKVSITILDKGR